MVLLGAARRRRTLLRRPSLTLQIKRHMSTIVMPRVRNLAHILFKQDSAKADKKKVGLCIVRAQSQFRIGWDIFLLVLLCYIALVTPVRIGFVLHPDYFSPEWWWEVCIDVFFFIDLLLNFRTTYYTIEGKEVVTGSRIATHYVKTWFTIDLVSSIPFDLIVEWWMNPNGTGSGIGLGNIQAAKTAKLAKGTRASKLVKIIRVLKLTKLVRLARASRMVQRYADVLYLSRNQLKLMRLFMVTLTIAHIIACGWGLVAHLNDHVDIDSWLLLDHSLAPAGGRGLLDASPMEQYLVAFYWSVATMITVGYGDVHPVNYSERLYAIFAIIIGGGYYGYIIASVASLVASWDINRKTYNERMDSVTTYMRVRKFPRHLYRRMRRYFRHYYAKQTSVDEHSILTSMSTALRREAVEFLVSDIRGRMLKGIPMFQALDGPQLAQVLSILRPLQAEEGQHIVTAGENGRELFILMSGRLCVQSSQGEVFAQLDPGACFGELAALGLKDKRSATIVATEFSELYSLTRTDIFNNFASNPAVLDKMVLSAAKNLQEYRESESESSTGSPEEAEGLKDDECAIDDDNVGGKVGGDDAHKKAMKNLAKAHFESHATVQSLFKEHAPEGASGKTSLVYKGEEGGVARSHQSLVHSQKILEKIDMLEQKISKIGDALQMLLNMTPPSSGGARVGIAEAASVEGEAVEKAATEVAAKAAI